MSPEGQNRCTVNINPNPADVFQYNTSTPIDQLRPMPIRQIVDEYNYFNLEYIKAPIPPKWKDNDNIMEDFKKLKQSCIRTFDGPMAHIMSGKVKTNMFLIWAGPDGEDIYENLQLSSSQQFNIDAVFEAFEKYCEPTCNFRATRFKFRMCANKMERISILFIIAF